MCSRTGVPRLRARQGGFAVAPLHSLRTPVWHEYFAISSYIVITMIPNESKESQSQYRLLTKSVRGGLGNTRRNVVSLPLSLH